MKINSLITMVILFISVNCIAQESENVELLAELYHTGDYKDFAIEEERLYVASGYGLEVFDISNPDSVVFLGRAPSQDSAESIAVKDGYVFLADWTRGVNLYDCRDPENITKDENFRYETASLFEELYIHENRLYISVANIGTRVYNISNPAEPENLSTYMRPRWPFGMVTQDSLTYIIDYYEDEIIVADLRNFRRYETLNEVQTNLQWPREISVMNSLLIVSYSGGGLSIYSLENPVEPELIIDYRDIDSHIWDVKLIGDYAYVGTSVSGLITLDLSNPAEPEIVAVDSTHSYTLHIESLAENLFVSGTLGLSILNAENPVELEQRDMYLKTHIVHSFSVGSDYLYLPRWEFGMHILNVSDPSQPEIINEIDSIGVVRVVATEDNWLYLNALDYETDETYLCAWNMEDPANPEETLRAELELPFGSYKIFNNFLTITNIDAGIIIYDISNRRNPEYITTISEYHYTEIFIDGEMLYCIDIDHNFYVYNISEIESPEYLDQHDDWDYAYSVVAEGDRVYVSCGGDGVRILNVSDPNFVSTERTISANDWITQCEIEDSLLYVCDYDAGARIFDIHSQEIPVEVGFVDTPGRAYTIAINDGIAYLGDVYDLTIFRYVEPGEVELAANLPPLKFQLSSPYPNPFNSTTTVTYTLPRPEHVQLTVFDYLGRRLTKLVDDHQDRGTHQAQWHSEEYPSGLYMLEMTGEGYRLTRNLVLEK